ncbi:hypothetical protein [Pedobacter aquatilis]|uniref:hypothetical protein n=1 Tax=Pedobacter aquatilis TaxID=351343 RepID=UPI002931642E|nr:hypothetical protein [Pedobacter aquatilis]
MAKVRSILKLSGTISGMTFVDSKAYGAHNRAKRGTYTPITLAEGMKESASVQTQVNLMAKVIFDAVNDFVPGFKDGKFWSRLLSVFRQQKKAGNGYKYEDFNLMEMRKDYPSTKFGTFRLTKVGDDEIHLSYILFKTLKCRLRLLRIATDQTLLNAYPLEVFSVDIVDETKMNSMPVEFSVLPAEACSLYVVHCELLINGKANGLVRDSSVNFLTVNI